MISSCADGLLIPRGSRVGGEWYHTRWGARGARGMARAALVDGGIDALHSMHMSSSSFEPGDGVVRRVRPAAENRDALAEKAGTVADHAADAVLALQKPARHRRG